MFEFVNVYIALADAAEEDGWKYVWVAFVPIKTDMGEIVAACQVLFPEMIGISIDPATENNDASE